MTKWIIMHNNMPFFFCVKYLFAASRFWYFDNQYPSALDWWAP